MEILEVLSIAFKLELDVITSILSLILVLLVSIHRTGIREK
jgi:hypothetical protein